MIRFVLPATQFVLIISKLFGLLKISWFQVFIPVYILIGLYILYIGILVIHEMRNK